MGNELSLPFFPSALMYTSPKSDDSLLTAIWSPATDALPYFVGFESIFPRKLPSELVLLSFGESLMPSSVFFFSSDLVMRSPDTVAAPPLGRDLG